jgi:hypothetical protein
LIADASSFSRARRRSDRALALRSFRISTQQEFRCGEGARGLQSPRSKFCAELPSSLLAGIRGSRRSPRENERGRGRGRRASKIEQGRAVPCIPRLTVFRVQRRHWLERRPSRPPTTSADRVRAGDLSE